MGLAVAELGEACLLEARVRVNFRLSTLAALAVSPSLHNITRTPDVHKAPLSSLVLFYDQHGGLLNRVSCSARLYPGLTRFQVPISDRAKRHMVGSKTTALAAHVDSIAKHLIGTLDLCTEALELKL